MMKKTFRPDRRASRGLFSVWVVGKGDVGRMLTPQYESDLHARSAAEELAKDADRLSERDRILVYDDVGWLKCDVTRPRGERAEGE